jgi:hypothetical protein
LWNNDYWSLTNTDTKFHFCKSLCTSKEEGEKERCPRLRQLAILWTSSMILKLAFLLYILGDTGSNLCLNIDYSDKITVFFLRSFSHTEITGFPRFIHCFVFHTEHKVYVPSLEVGNYQLRCVSNTRLLLATGTVQIPQIFITEQKKKIKMLKFMSFRITMQCWILYNLGKNIVNTIWMTVLFYSCVQNIIFTLVNI